MEIVGGLCSRFALPPRRRRRGSTAAMREVADSMAEPSTTAKEAWVRVEARQRSSKMCARTAAWRSVCVCVCVSPPQQQQQPATVAARVPEGAVRNHHGCGRGDPRHMARGSHTQRTHQARAGLNMCDLGETATRIGGRWRAPGAAGVWPGVAGPSPRARWRALDHPAPAERRAAPATTITTPEAPRAPLMMRHIHSSTDEDLQPRMEDDEQQTRLKPFSNTLTTTNKATHRLNTDALAQRSYRQKR